MLQVKNISKTYKTGDLVQVALDDVSLNLRDNEFVAILGPSGSGKTTLLNIIGGLDKYTDGDLIINGRSTKEYTDNDWDLYRNHSIGFVFQSYNLIPHQTALANVELALTLSGVGKAERRKRAIEMLTKVGLEDQIYKKPSQMSGGQTQRIAIARALINNPDILLADEPTGALDSETSIQVMDILKEVAKDRLVIMVTHNPDLAKEYSTRIIKLKDGEIIDDSNPYDGKNDKKEKVTRKAKKNFMSFKTALGLSLNNLATKKGRTILTAFAGAIGIIGIALISSMSNGVNEYITGVEQDTLSSYPITIESATIDASSLLESFRSMRDTDPNTKENTVETNNIMGDMITTMNKKIESNDLKTFKNYLEKSDKFEKYSNAIQYSYNLNLQIYKNDLENITKLNPSTIFEQFGYDTSASYGSMMASGYNELLDNEELLKSQYKVLAGHMPKKYDEIVLIVDKNNRISDYAAYTLGLRDQKELAEVIPKMMMGEEITFDTTSYTYDEILNLKYKVLLNTDYYKKEKGIWINKETDKDFIKDKLKNALEIKVVGIIKIDDDSVLSSSSTGGIGYTHALTEYVINKINETEIAKEQKANPEKNIFTGFNFTAGSFDINNLSAKEKAYLSTLSSEQIASLMANASNSSYENNLLTLGIVDIDSPSAIFIYPKDFESKDAIKDLIENYNDKKTSQGKDNEVISYTDYVGLLMSSVTTIIDVIGYVLIGFVSVSLVVSSIMIGIITYISVLERTKEIGILRAIGASKKDISRVFNAETFIIGLFSGVLGIVVTLILNIPINIIIDNLAGINNISKLPVYAAILLIVISTLLTVIGGLIPSRIASKKDPVEALRTE